MKNTNVYYVIPKALKDKLNSVEFKSQKNKNKAKKFISKLINEGMKNNWDLEEYVLLPTKYIRKVYGGRYNDEFMSILIKEDIIERTKYYSKNDKTPKGYRIKQDWLLEEEYESDSFVNERKEGLEDETNISINKEVSIILNKSSSSYNLSTIHSSNLPYYAYMLHQFPKSIMADDLKSLKIDSKRIWEATKQRIDSLSCIDFKIDAEIDATYIMVRNRISDNSYWVSKEKALSYVKEKGYSLIQDGRKYYIDDLDHYISLKKKNILLNYRSYSCKLDKGIFNISRNTTNTRLDSIISSMCKHTVKIIKQDNDLIEIDLCNSQFVILANWLSEEGMVDMYEDVKQFYNLCISGSLYKSLYAYMLHQNEKETKLAMMQICFSSHKSGSKDKTKLKELFPNVVRFIDNFKKQNGSEQFAIELQRREANIFIDNLLPNIKDNGFLCITKHDSLIVRRSDAGQVMKIVNAYFGYKGIKCSAKCDGDIIGIGLNEEIDSEPQQQDQIFNEVDNTTLISDASNEDVNGLYDDFDNAYVGMKDENGYPSIKYYRLSYNLSEEEAQDMYEGQFNM